MKAAALGLAVLLTGCGAYDVRQARDPLGRSRIIGMALPDLLGSLGKPDAIMRTVPDTALIEYVRLDPSTGLKATVSLLGSIEIGGGGGCKVVLTILRSGTVADVAFPASYSDQLFSPPYSACAPLVQEAIAHPNGAGAPAGYDAFAVLFPETAGKP